MIIIFNLSGRVVGIAGCFIGLFVFAVTGWLGAGLVGLAIVWFGAGIWWRNFDVKPGQKRAYPSIFFIPLPFWAFAVIILAVPVLILQAILQPDEQSRPSDWRADKFEIDEGRLRVSTASGDVELSKMIIRTLKDSNVWRSDVEEYHVFARTNESAI